MIRVTDLNREQLVELKQMMLIDSIESEERINAVSYSELANADNLISDNEVYAMYGSVCFVPEDFISENI